MTGKKKQANRWLIAVIVGMAGGLSFELPYLKITYQPQMEFAFGITSTQVGIIMSLYGLLALIFYPPSGIIADKYNHRNLISVNLAITGALGFVMATYPPYPVLLIIEVLWAITTILFMWSATVKAVSMQADENDAGALMGLSEGARGVACLLAAIITLFIFNKLGAENNINSFKGVLIAYGVMMILLAVACWFVVPDGKTVSPLTTAGAEAAASQSISKADVVSLLKMNKLWFCALYVFGTYMSYACLTYTTSYMVDCFELSMSAATAISILRNQVFRTFCGPLGGLLTVKTSIRSATRWLQMGSIVNTTAFVLLAVLPIRKSMLIPVVAIVVAASFSMYLSRGLYFATIKEVGIPDRISGTAIGLMSLIGFIPDAFVYILIGHWQDTLEPVTAYRLMWILGIAGTTLATVMSVLLLRIIKQRKAAAALEADANAEVPTDA